MTSDMNTGNGMGRGMGMGMGMGMGRGMGMGMGMGRGMGMGMGMGRGMGMGMGMGSGMGMGMGMGSGMGMGMGTDPDMGEIPVGADGGIGFVRSYYATPVELALLPWALNFTPDNAGNPPFPLDYIISPYQRDRPILEWTTQDWDPDLRFWTLPFDTHLTEWLRAADRSEPGTLAALEFAGQADLWNPLVGFDPETNGAGWLEPDDLKWRPSGNSQQDKDAAFSFIKGELEALKHYMEDDRQSYLVESDVQADGLPFYLVHFLGINSFDHPYTLQLIDIGLAMGNVAYMSYKAHYKRVRPSILRPGLTVPFGPPAHPAFPSGHSFLAHFISLLLCEIPGIAARYGVQRTGTAKGDGHVLRKPDRADLAGRDEINSPIFTIAQRIAVNRERIGVHYPSDSYASRHLAAGIWERLMKPVGDAERINCPTLDTIISHAKSEWPDSWVPLQP